jgi:diguanylate cyclase (GGDEF)-like protein/PAS domain S-box-containing protein
MHKKNLGFLAFSSQNETERSLAVLPLLALLIFLAALGMLVLDKEVLQSPWVILAIALGLFLLGGTVAARGRAWVMASQAYVGWLEREVAAKTAELHLAQQTLAPQERHRHTLVDAAPVGIAELDAQGYCRYLNPVGCALNACDENAARGRHFFEFVHPDDRDYVEFVWQLNATHEEANWLEFRLRDTAFWVSAHWINRFEVGQRLTGSIIIFIDNTQQRCRDQQVWTQAHYDALTGLPNRSLFWERLSQSLLRARREHQNLAVLWIDLDGFKAINDRWGHAAGDELLQQAALRLSSRVRDSDTVARMGGDEFAVILPGFAESDAVESVAVDLVDRLAEPFALRGGAGQISASIGVALYPLDAKDAEFLVRYADMAMYAAKRAGKNQVVVWRPDLEHQIRRGKETESHTGC